MQDLSRISFGATSAVTSSLALLIGLTQLGVSKEGIIGALLVIAFADNLADSLGMHVYAESKSRGYSKASTVMNYLVRLGLTLFIVVIVVVLPTVYALAASIAIGLCVLAALSYFIAKAHNLKPGREMVSHLVVAVLVLVASQLVGSAIKAAFG